MRLVINGGKCALGAVYFGINNLVVFSLTQGLLPGNLLVCPQNNMASGLGMENDEYFA